MRPILRVEILPLAEYEDVRDAFRGRIIAAKKPRRVKLGADMSGYFENRDSVHLQVQEMLRTERIVAESAIQHELATYNELVPGDLELSFTLFVEVPDKSQRDRMLIDLAKLEQSVALEVDGEAFAFDGKREGATDERTTAVHYLKVKLSPAAAASIRERRAKAAIVIAHPKYEARADLGADAIASLAEDLS